MSKKKKKYIAINKLMNTYNTYLVLIINTYYLRIIRLSVKNKQFYGYINMIFKRITNYNLILIEIFINNYK